MFKKFNIAQHSRMLGYLVKYIYLQGSGISTQVAISISCILRETVILAAAFVIQHVIPTIKWIANII